MRSRTRTRPARVAAITASIAAMLTLSAPAQSAIVGYDSQSTFNAAISGWTKTLTNFDSQTVGATYAMGTGPTGSGFTLALSGGSAGSYLPAIANRFWTTSGTQYLGLDNPDTALEAGDVLTFTFTAPVQAFGLFVIGGGDVLPGDMRLTTGLSSITNSGTADLADGTDSYAYFLGFASDNSDTFSSLTLDYATWDGAYLLPIAVDDVVLAVNDSGGNNGGNQIPEPGTLGLMFAGLLAMGFRLRKSFV